MRRRPRQRAAVPTSLASARSNLSRLTTLPSPQPPFLRRVVTIYSSANATTPATMKQKYVVGPLPDMVAWNHDCTKIAVANEGEGVYTDDGLVPPPSLRACLSPTQCPTPAAPGACRRSHPRRHPCRPPPSFATATLAAPSFATAAPQVDPVGSVSIIEGFDVGGMDGEVKTVDFAAVAETDEALKAKGVHLPLELKVQSLDAEFPLFSATTSVAYHPLTFSLRHRS